MRRSPDEEHAGLVNLHARQPEGQVLERMQAGFGFNFVVEMALCCLRRFVRFLIERRERQGCRVKAIVY